MKKPYNSVFQSLNSTFEGYAINAYMKKHRVLNFSPGPSQFPILLFDMLKLDSFPYGTTPFELSHRSPEFVEMMHRVNEKVRTFMCIPEDFSILWMPNGAHGQFSAIPLNLSNIIKEEQCNYVVNGTWSHRALEEGSKFSNAYNSHSSPLLPLQMKDIQHEPMIHEKDKYIFLCSNETINGLEFRYDGIQYPTRTQLKNTLSIIDMSSDFGMKNINWYHKDIVFSCSSKNFGIPGTTIVIVRNDILYQIQQHKPTQIPCTLDWNFYKNSNSLYNTPSIFTIYIIEKILDYYLSIGGIQNIENTSKIKAKMIYDFLDKSHIYNAVVNNKKTRSNINIPFIVNCDDPNIPFMFLDFCYKQNIVGLRTKTPFSYNDYNIQEPFRISLYNGISIEDTKKLIYVMKQFQDELLFYK